MGFRHLGVQLSLRVVALLGELVLLAWALVLPGYHAAAVLLVVIAALQVAELVRFLARGNRELTRFLDALRYGDFSQRFQFEQRGAGFGELGEACTAIVERFKQQRQQQERDLRQLRALLEHVPVPLISAHGDGRLTLWNNAARRLFGAVAVTRVEDLRGFGEPLYRSVCELQPGQRQLTGFSTEGVELQLAITAAELVTEGASEKLISLHNIQGELDRTELRAWQDLIRVLTHEIMNSITPVASLSQTAVDLIDDVRNQPDDAAALADVAAAVATVASRSDSLMQFVSRYRALARLPEPQRETFLLMPLLEQVQRVVSAGDTAVEVSWRVTVEPESLSLQADRQMVEQVLINLAQNACQAVASGAEPEVTLQARLNSRGQVVVQVRDNGPGVPAALVDTIFVPFFTTRAEGSGVGLALARQVMIAHGGQIGYRDSTGGGACFSLVF